MIYTAKAFRVFLASNFLRFVPNRFAMLQITFYKQLRSGDSAESCLWL